MKKVLTKKVLFSALAVLGVAAAFTVRAVVKKKATKAVDKITDAITGKPVPQGRHSIARRRAHEAIQSMAHPGTFATD
jgi:hypothetical protein